MYRYMAHDRFEHLCGTQSFIIYGVIDQIIDLLASTSQTIPKSDVLRLREGTSVHPRVTQHLRACHLLVGHTLSDRVAAIVE